MSPPERPAGLRYHPGAGATVAFGPFRFDRANRLLFREGAEIALPPRVLGVLEFLIDRAGRVVSKEALIDEVWKGSHVTDTSPAEAISLLRQALADDAQSPRYVQTVHRRGYRFVAQVSAASAPAPEPATPVAATTRITGLDAPDAPSDPELPVRGEPTVQPGRALWIVALAAVLAAAAFVAGRLSAPPQPVAAPEPVAFTLTLPEGNTLLPYRSSLAFSPDERWLAIAAHRNGESRLLLRAMDRVELRGVPHTEGATSPFFSPDSRSIAFFADGQIRRVSIAGGPPVPLATAPKGLGGAWTENGHIYFNRSTTGGLWRIRAEGGEPELVTHPDPGAGEVAHLWPVMVPGGLLYTVWSTTFDDARIVALPAAGGPAHTLVERAGQPVFVPPDRLVFVGPAGLRVAGFDPHRLRITSPQEPLPYPVSVNPVMLLGVHALSPSGALAFQPGEAPVGERRIAFLDAAGRAAPLDLPDLFFRNVAWDPVHQRFAATVLDGARSDVWVGGDGAMPQRLTHDGFNIEPVWSRDGRRVAFASSHGGVYEILERPADASAPALVLSSGDRHRHPDSWSPDGSALLFGLTHPETGFDLWMRELIDGAWIEQPFLATPADEFYGSFSPDGRFVVYQSNASGRLEVLVRPAEGEGGPWMVSHDGGFDPLWSSDGSEIYYGHESRVLAVPFSAAGEVRLGAAELLFEEPDLVALRAVGRRRFLAILEQAAEAKGGEEIRIVLHALASGG